MRTLSVFTKASMIAAIVLYITACGQSSKSGEESSSSALASVSKAAMRNDGVTLSAPQYVMVSMNAHLSLNAPSNITIVSANWNFSDGESASGTAVDHQFFTLGLNTVTVEAVDSLGTQLSFSQPVTVIAYNEILYCISDLALSAPQDVELGSAAAMSVTIPPCLKAVNASVSFNYGDGSAAEKGEEVTHTYASAGTYTVNATVTYDITGVSGSFPLTQQVTVAAAAPPTPPDPMSCPTGGETRQLVGSNYTKTNDCGVSGREIDTYHDVVTQTCIAQADETLKWTETSRTSVLVSKGECKNQACALPDGALTGVDVISQNLIKINGIYYLMDGQSLGFYSSQSPAGACTDVQQTRTCSNGTLSGSANYIYLMCKKGCDGFGPNGTVKEGVVVGQVNVDHACTYGEAGIKDIFSQIADQKCENGAVTTSNLRQGSLVSAGVCPTYKWTATDAWSACSADCGGTQTQAYKCVNGSNEVADPARCQGAAPVVTRLCDGNPEAVKRSDVQTSADSSGSTKMCPSNQIGVITQSRDVTVTTNYACIDHQVKVASSSTAYGAWETESYCRDFVAYRCSQDSLDNTQAGGRYDWMVKCAAQVPVIQQFLAEFADVKTKVDGGYLKLGDKGRVLYPTFMYTASAECKGNSRNKDGSKTCTSTKVWIAPTKASASCAVPDGIYVAGVCVSSCATPEQQILAGIKAEKKLKPMSFEEAWEQKVPLVATLKAGANPASKEVRGSKVEQWVTEMMDTEHEILEFHMQSGGVLRLTPNHTLLGADAMMHLASEFKTGDDLIKLGFEKDRIVEIRSTTYFGKVYNVFVQSADPRQNIVVTNGYLNGSAFFQNEGADLLNKDVLRIRLTRGVFDK